MSETNAPLDPAIEEVVYEVQAPIKPVPEEEKLKLADVPSTIKGDQRLPGESDVDLKARRKNEKRLMRMRLRYGTKQYKHDGKGKAKPFVNTEKRIEKSIRAQKKIERDSRAKARREERKQN